MDRIIKSRRNGSDFGPKLALLASAAIATAALSGCATASAPRADVSFDKAQSALEKGKTTKALSHAEAAVQAEPRNGTYRALLGKAYLEAGRYAAASQSFGEALELGNTDSRTVLSYALTTTAIGKGKTALNELLEWETALDPADAGLAIALAGNPKRGVFILTNALRAGQNTPKLRQNLAYTYALDGNWRAARVMAAEDVPADQLDARLSDWAAKARPEDHMLRISSLLGVAPTTDDGMPARLALANFPSTQEMVAEAKAKMPVDQAPAQIAAAPGQPSQTEAMTFEHATAPVKAEQSVKRVAQAPTPVAPVAPVAKPAPKPAPVAAPTPRVSSKTVQPAGPRFISRPVAQKLPQAAPAKRVAQAPKPKPTPKRVASAPAGDTHLVQLGSYVSKEEAKRGWVSLKRKFPQLASHDLVVTKAEVKGKIYYRVAAAGFGRQGAAQMCSAVRSSGRGCFAYSKANPPKGAVDKGTRFAAAR